MGTAERVERVLAPLVESLGLELVDVEALSGRLRITLDREGGVDLDAIGSATSAISRALDEADAVSGGSYELEVSSPGLERRLRTPEHFEGQLGREVSLKLKPGTNGERRLSGRLVTVDKAGLELEDATSDSGRRRVLYDEVERALTVFDWRSALEGTSAPSSRRSHKQARRTARQGLEQDNVRRTETR